MASPVIEALTKKYPLWRTKQWPEFKTELDKFRDYERALYLKAQARMKREAMEGTR